MRVEGKSIVGFDRDGEVGRIIEAAINANSYTLQAQDFENALREYQEYGGKSKLQIKRYQDLAQNWINAARKERETLVIASNEVLREAINTVQTLEDFTEEDKRAVLQELKFAFQDQW